MIIKIEAHRYFCSDFDDIFFAYVSDDSRKEKNPENKI